MQLKIAEIDRVTRKQDNKLKAKGKAGTHVGMFGKNVVKDPKDADPYCTAILDEIDAYQRDEIKGEDLLKAEEDLLKATEERIEQF